MIKIWGRRNAYNVQKVLWFINELGVEYEQVDIGSKIDELESGAFLAMNPHGRIPVIKDGDTYLWESNTILRYFSASYGEPLFWSESPSQRALIERWMDWELATLQADFLALFWSFYRTPEAQRDSKKIEQLITRCEKNMVIINNHLQHNSYMAGDKFTLGDITVGTSFYRYFNMGIEVPVLPNLRRWYQQLTNRPEYQNNIMLPFEELKGRLEF